MAATSWGEIKHHVLDAPTAGAIRTASMRFKHRTALGSDAFHPRWFAMLSDEALTFLGQLMVYMER
eukprot:9034876-Pyramimonas_sp.AAC.1